MEDILRTLVAFKSVTGDAEPCAALLDYAEAFLRTRGMHVQRLTSNGYESLVASTRAGNKKPRVMLAAHVDVVKASDELFTLRRQNGKFYGRGVFDMKFAAAIYLDIVDEIQKNLQDYDFCIALTTDEEVSGKDGSGYLLQQGWRPAVAILPDGGDNWQIETSAKGVLHGDLEAFGRTAHGSRPWEGDSATYKLLSALHEFKELFAQQNLHTSTLNIGILRAGEVRNQIPDYARASLDIRYPLPSDLETIRSDLRQLCQKYDVRFTDVHGCIPCFNQLEHPLVAAFARRITEVTGVIVTGSNSQGSSDARLFYAQNIPCILVEPPGGERHGNGEWLARKGFMQFRTILRKYLEEVTKEQKSVDEPLSDLVKYQRLPKTVAAKRQ